MTLTIEETPFLELIPLNPLNPISIKKSKIRPNNSSLYFIHSCLLNRSFKINRKWNNTENNNFSLFLRGLSGIKGD